MPGKPEFFDCYVALGIGLQEGLALGAERTLTIPVLWLRDQRELQGQSAPCPHFTDWETEVQRAHSLLVAKPRP